VERALALPPGPPGRAEVAHWACLLPPGPGPMCLTGSDWRWRRPSVTGPGGGSLGLNFECLQSLLLRVRGSLLACGNESLADAMCYLKYLLTSDNGSRYQ
jgi:hypothetical protein